MPEGTSKLDCALARNAFTKEQLTLGFYEGVDVTRNLPAEAQWAQAQEARQQRNKRQRALREQQRAASASASQPDSQTGFPFGGGSDDDSDEYDDGNSDDDDDDDGDGLFRGRAEGRGVAYVSRHIDKKKFNGAKVWTMMDALSRRVAGVAGGAPKAGEAIRKLDVGEKDRDRRQRIGHAHSDRVGAS